MADLEDRRSRDRREEVADHALDVFLAKGYARASMADIARSAGIEKSSVYHHFSSKEDLFLFALSKDFAHPMKEIEEISHQYRIKPREALELSLNILYDVMIFSPIGRFTTVIAEASRTVPAVAEGFHDRFILEFERVLDIALTPARNSNIIKDYNIEQQNIIVFSPLMQIAICSVIFSNSPRIIKKYLRPESKENFVDMTMAILLKE